MEFTEQVDDNIPLLHKVLIEQPNPVEKFFHQNVFFYCVYFSNLVPNVLDPALDVSIRTLLYTKFKDALHNIQIF